RFDCDWSSDVCSSDLLIDRGAEIDPIEQNWNNTPINFAVWHDYPRMIELLGAHTRNIGTLVFAGNVDRVRELVRAEPDLAKGDRSEERRVGKECRSGW